MAATGYDSVAYGILCIIPALGKSFTTPVGSVMNATETRMTFNPWRYYAEYYDSETDNYYLRARFYGPASYRMLSEDSHWNVGNRQIACPRLYSRIIKTS